MFFDYRFSAPKVEPAPRLSAILLCFVVLVSHASPVWAAEKLVIPIFYATDRKLDVDNTNEQNFLDEQVPDWKPGERKSSEDGFGRERLSYGVKNIVLVGDDFAVATPERTTGLGWWNILPERQVDASAASIGNRMLTRQELLHHLSSIISSGPSKRPLVLYVHGCCVSFKPTTEAAARLAFEMKAPVLLYAWAAYPSTVQNYRNNELRFKAGVARFQQFLHDLESSIEPDRVILIAHSMGNRFLYDALRDRYFKYGSNPEHPKFRSTAFTAADVQLDDFLVDEDGVAYNSACTLITANDKDPALAASNFQRGFYQRLGAPGKTKINRLAETEGVEVLDIRHVYGRSHDFPKEVVSDRLRDKEGGYSNKYRYLQRRQRLFDVQK